LPCRRGASLRSVCKLVVSYLVVGLDVQLDLFAGQGADSVWVVSADARREEGGLFGGVCVLDLHAGESVCEGRWCAREKCGWYGELGGVGVVSKDGGAVFGGRRPGSDVGLSRPQSSHLHIHVAGSDCFL
jgi:hypothetical protein